MAYAVGAGSPEWADYQSKSQKHMIEGARAFNDLGKCNGQKVCGLGTSMLIGAGIGAGVGAAAAGLGAGPGAGVGAAVGAIVYLATQCDEENKSDKPSFSFKGHTTANKINSKKESWCTLF